jgi:pimeloyl-ACP methyl ester carboxylesterase
MKATRKELLFTGLLASLIAIGVGLWERPVSFLNAYSYLRLSLAGVRSRSVSVNGLRVHYDVSGPNGGPVVVLVHGLSGRAEDWQNLSPYLVKAGYIVYMLDLPGFGRSDKPAGFSYSVQDQAAVVLGFLDALDLKRVDLGGWSMGGWIVQLAVFQHPERVRKLILFDSAGLDEAPTWNTNLFAPASIAELHELEALLTPHPAKIPDFVSRDIVRRFQNNAWVTHRALQTMLTGRNTTDFLLPKLKLPVLIVWSADDKMFPLRQGQTMHDMVPQSHFEVVTGCGHMVVIECASQIGPKVVEFLKQYD